MVKPGYKQTEIGVIPEDWGIKPAKDLMRIETGSRNTEHKVDYGQYPFFVRSQQVERIDTYHYNCEAVLTAGDGVGTGKVFHYINGKFDAHQRVYVMSNFRGILGKYFLYFFSKNFGAEVSKYTAKSSVDSVRRDMIAEMLIPVPSEDEQKDIYEAVSDVEQLIEILEKQLAKEKDIKQGAMQELLTGKRRLPGFEGKWQLFVFGDLFDFIPNNAFTRAQMDVSGRAKNIHYGDILTKYGAYISADSKDIPYIAKEIDLSRFSEKCYLQSGDLVIADTAEDETVGKALEVINVECPVLAGQHTLLCRPKVRFAKKFLGYYLNGACYHDQLIPYIVGTKVSSVSKASMAQTRLVVPDYEEQQAIAEIVSNMDSEIEALEQKLAKYRQVKQGMMQQLLTGKIRLM